MGIPRFAGTDLRGAVVAAAVVTGLFVTLLLHPGDQASLARLEQAIGLACYASVFGAGVLTYFYWRIVSAAPVGRLDNRLAPWFMVALTAGGISGMLQVAMVDPGRGGGLGIGQLGVMLALCGCAGLMERKDLPWEPSLVCATIAVGLPAAYKLLTTTTTLFVVTVTHRVLFNTALMLVGLVLARIILGRTLISRWARQRLAASIVLLTFAQCLQNLDRHHAFLMVLAIGGYVVGTVTLCSIAHRLLRASILERQSEMQVLRRSLAEIRASTVQDRELLHEVGATTASRVMRAPQGLSAYRRRRLESMLAAELTRLERLMDHHAGSDASGPDELIDLDAVVEPIVTSHQTRGRRVLWQPSGEHAYGDRDELAELCNILLENAARHARGAPVTLSVVARDGGVEVICSDQGPGVAPAARDRIFEAEVKGSNSQGQGLGLAIARRLATSRGGDIVLLDDGRPGATFAARLPMRERSDVHRHHVA
jgi:signal transduction histidine kinase